MKGHKMKRMIRYRNDSYVNSALEAMSQSFENESIPSLGIFWYDTENKELFGVLSSTFDDCKEYKSSNFGCTVKTISKLHEQVWKKEHFRGKDSRFLIRDYTSVPRGRVFWFGDTGFVVYTGDWIDEYTECKEQILFEFDLPSDTKFKKDGHWDIGYGWSYDLI